MIIRTHLVEKRIVIEFAVMHDSPPYGPVLETSGVFAHNQDVIFMRAVVEGTYESMISCDKIK